MKKGTKIIICILVILLVLVINKVLIYNKYKSKQEIIIVNDGYETINHKDTKDYLEHNGIKIRNDFKKYTYEESDDTYVLYDNNEDIINMFSIHKVETLLTIFKEYDDILKKSYIEKFLNENNIKNDMDLLNYISNYEKDITIFNSNKEIKLDYYIRNYINDVMPLVYEYRIVKGDYSGIIVFNYNHEEEDAIEIMLLNKDVRYILSFIGSEISEKNILDLVGTVIFDEKE